MEGTTKQAADMSREISERVFWKKNCLLFGLVLITLAVFELANIVHRHLLQFACIYI